ncbi:hypothetical protein SASPL_115860 [Salvia splendens]|uniref:Uncharacterized protein n=1 Tax=Salvia splendens TaxID=180675 RepID=A0A8X8Y4J5_SALSN|nr:hypothetical protein SASPL_115860 [Salvia splendens]
MAEDHPSRYVKLTKDQDRRPWRTSNPASSICPLMCLSLIAPLSYIFIVKKLSLCFIPQLHVRKCNECGQPLPDSYHAPADEPWTTGIFGCAEDAESCKTGLFCPCVLFGRNRGGIAVAAATAALHGFVDPRTCFLIGEGFFFGWWMCGIYTGQVRRSLQKKYHLKEHREMKSRISEYSVEPMAMVNPPPVQEMNAADDGRDSASTSANGNDQVKIEMQAL